MLKILKWIAIIIVVLVVISVIFGKDDKAQQASSSAEPTTPAEPPIEVTANELLNAYKNNEVAANQQFKGKTLLVSATVGSIDAGISDEPYLTLKAGGEYEFNQPQAHLADAEQNKAASLSKGQKIKLLCTGNSEIAGTPMLDNCSIQ
ncbi:hypothetical protein QX205_15720 [Acinetobacter pittii]|uniref:OB-fold protein n=1 Tax=Acinetobacter pittii TaxID=48296 RepID=UPI0025B5E01D|nr:hypothetical protein [Acinetobacter pittii]MDN4021524.1 hypothetical protein [Acinetobacter pittii]